MNPPMNDPVILMQPLIVDGIVQKDGRGIETFTENVFTGRVTNESSVTIDDQGKEIRPSHTVVLPSQANPKRGDRVKVVGEIFSLNVLKAKPRKSWSGKKIYYWVLSCEG